MFKDRRSVCPKCGTDKFSKLYGDRALKQKGTPYLPRVYFCKNGHQSRKKIL